MFVTNMSCNDTDMSQSPCPCCLGDLVEQRMKYRRCDICNTSTPGRSWVTWKICSQCQTRTCANRDEEVSCDLLVKCGDALVNRILGVAPEIQTWKRQEMIQALFYALQYRPESYEELLTRFFVKNENAKWETEQLLNLHLRTHLGVPTTAVRTPRNNALICSIIRGEEPNCILDFDDGELWIKALREAFKHHNVALIEALRTQVPVSAKWVGNLALCSYRYGNEVLMDELFADSKFNPLEPFDYPGTVVLSESEDSNEDNVFRTACYSGNINVVKKLLHFAKAIDEENLMNLNTCINDLRKKGLEWAITSKSLELVDWLLNQNLVDIKPEVLSSNVFQSSARWTTTESIPRVVFGLFGTASQRSALQTSIEPVPQSIFESDIYLQGNGFGRSLEIAEMLFKHFETRDDLQVARFHAFVGAYKFGFASLLGQILINGVPQGDKPAIDLFREALRDACVNHSNEVVAVLVAQGRQYCLELAGEGLLAELGCMSNGYILNLFLGEISAASVFPKNKFNVANCLQLAFQSENAVAVGHVLVQAIRTIPSELMSSNTTDSSVNWSMKVIFEKVLPYIKTSKDILLLFIRSKAQFELLQLVLSSECAKLINTEILVQDICQTISKPSINLLEIYIKFHESLVISALMRCGSISTKLFKCHTFRKLLLLPSVLRNMNTLFLDAIKAGDYEIVSYLLDHENADPNSFISVKADSINYGVPSLGFRFKTATNTIVVPENAKVVELLLNHPRFHVNDNGTQLIALAIQTKSTQVAELYLKDPRVHPTPQDLLQFAQKSFEKLVLVFSNENWFMQVKSFKQDIIRVFCESATSKEAHGLLDSKVVSHKEVASEIHSFISYGQLSVVKRLLPYCDRTEALWNFADHSWSMGKCLLDHGVEFDPERCFQISSVQFLHRVSQLQSVIYHEAIFCFPKVRRRLHKFVDEQLMFSFFILDNAVTLPIELVALIWEWSQVLSLAMKTEEEENEVIECLKYGTQENLPVGVPS